MVTSLSPNRVNGLAKNVPSSGPNDMDQPHNTQMMPTIAIAMNDIIIMLSTDLARVMPP